MAKIIFSALVADARNSIGDIVFSRSRYGAYARARTSPTNPNSAKQIAVRDRFATINAGWSTLTEPQRKSWIDGAKTFPFIDIFGYQRILSPASLYLKLNINLSIVNRPAITTLPLPVTMPQIATLNISSSQAAGTVVTTGSVSPVPNGFYLVSFITPNLSPGIYFAKKYYRFCGVTGTLYDWASHSIPSNIGVGNYGTLVESPVAGMKMFVKLFLINGTSGQASVPQQASCIITA
jgi:hypothetical protein